MIINNTALAPLPKHEMKALVVTDQQQQEHQQLISDSEENTLELSCNSDLVRSYDVLKAVPMGHKGKFYQRILSEQRQSLVDVSQSLPNSLHDNVVEANGNGVEIESRELDGDVNNGLLFGEGNLNATTGQEVWFNTWPERCEKGENGKMSPRSYNNHLLNNTRPIASKPCDNHQQQSNSTNALNNGKKVSLNEALQNISLAYSPVTKKLHLITRNNLNNSQQNNEQEGLLSQKNYIENTQQHNKNLKESTTAINSDEPMRKTHRRIQAGSFSSTVSSISDISPSGSLLDTDTDNASECSDIGFTKTGKKKGLMQFFNRNVFSSWKASNSSSTAGVWNLFNKGSSDGLESPKHEAIVASSSALIQLKRPSNLPAKTLEEEQKHREEYEAMIAAAKRKEALNSVARQRQQKLQLQLEEQQAASAKHFLQTVLPNWEATCNLRKTRDLWWQGLPSSVRGRVWRKAIGNDLNLTPQLYEICLARAQTLIKSESSQNQLDNNRKVDLSDAESILNSRKSSGGSIGPCGTPADLMLSNSRKSSGASVDPCGTPITISKEALESRKSSGASLHTCRTPIRASDPAKGGCDLIKLECLRKSSGSSLQPCSGKGGGLQMPVSRRCSVTSDCCSGVLSVDQQQQANLAAVQLDIARVFPNLCIFQEGGPYSEVLNSLLAAYVCYRPDVGYVQGMAYLAAILTLNLDPVHSFIAFANILNRPLHLAAYTLDERALTARYRAFERCLGAQLPKLCAHMASAHLTPDLYLLDWVYTVYAKAMPLDVTSRVWDVWLRDGEEEFVFRTALGILHLYQDQLLTMDFLHGSQFLTRLPEDLSSEQLFRSIGLVNTSVGKQTFAQIVHGFCQSGNNASL